MNEVKQIGMPIAICLAAAVAVLTFVLLMVFEQPLLGAITIVIGIIRLSYWRSTKR